MYHLHELINMKQLIIHDKHVDFAKIKSKVPNSKEASLVKNEHRSFTGQQNLTSIFRFQIQIVKAPSNVLWIYPNTYMHDKIIQISINSSSENILV